MHILVTGGAGYVGSAAAAHFLAAGYRVTVFDSLVKGHRDAVPEGPFDVIVLSGSVAEVPKHLLSMLRDGGRLAAIVGQEPVMRFTLVRRTGDRFDTTSPWDTIAPRLVGFAEPSGFSF